MFQICDDFWDIDTDDESRNHIKIFGKKQALNLYLNSRSNFIILLKRNNIYNSFFKELVDIINNKIEKKI